jgi:FtsZ-interacting cell division protein ZipA
MRILFVLGALAIAGLVVTGAIRMQKSGDTISIQINKQQVREEAEKVIEEGREVLHEAEGALPHDGSQR